MVRRFPLIVLISIAIAACSRTPSGPSTVDAGMWGGDHIMLTVTDKSSHLELDCAHGDIPGPLTADRGTIAVTGTFVREHGGPIRVDETADAHPALYSGMLTGSTLQLSIRLTDSGEVIGSFSLTRGATGRIAKCL